MLRQIRATLALNADMTHFDMSVWAFEKIASTVSLREHEILLACNLTRHMLKPHVCLLQKWGVIELLYRPVPCTYKPANPAPEPANPTPGIPPPPGAVHP